MSPDSEVSGLIVDLCSQVEGLSRGLREELQVSLYEICGGLNNHITREMDRLVYHVRRLIDQNGFLYDRVIELEKRDDSKKVRSRDRHLHNPKKGEILLHACSPETLDALRPGGARRRVRSHYRQAG